MPSIRYFATCIKGLEPALVKELTAPEIGAQEVSAGSSGVHFSGDPATGYRANLWMRSAIRILGEAARGPAPSPEALYEWARALDWAGWMSVRQTFSVEARVWDSAITHSKYASLRIKDALCDFFRAKTGERPNVDVEQADLPLFLYVYRDEAILYRDFSGTTLHKRGYREVMHKSSLNESMAAGILILSGWDRTSNLCDPMCGAGTFLIEAAGMALRRAPGLARKKFPFQSWPDFDREAWKECKSRAHSAARYELPCVICGNDIHSGALSLARRDLEAAGLAEFVQLSEGDAAEYVPPAPPGIIVSNPPWGERLESEDPAEAWRRLKLFLERQAREVPAFLLSGNMKPVREAGLKADSVASFRHGKLETKLLRVRS